MRQEKGFSLIELLIVVAIILIIAAIAIPNLLRARIAANESSAVASIRTINTAMISYDSSYPTVGYASSLSVLGGSCTGTTVPTTSCGLLDRFDAGWGHEKRIHFQSDRLGWSAVRSLLRIWQPVDFQQHGRTLVLLDSGCGYTRNRYRGRHHVRRHGNSIAVSWIFDRVEESPSPCAFNSTRCPARVMLPFAGNGLSIVPSCARGTDECVRPCVNLSPLIKREIVLRQRRSGGGGPPRLTLGARPCPWHDSSLRARPTASSFLRSSLVKSGPAAAGRGALRETWMTPTTSPFGARTGADMSFCMT